MESAINMSNKKALLKHDGRVQISTGKSRFEKSWKNKEMMWSVLVSKLQTPVITPESYAEYVKMSKADQDNIKDVGGYVGGTLKEGRRSRQTVASRQILTLDLDFAPADYFKDLELMGEYAACTYSTHKHSPNKPRYRLLVPLDRAVSPEEYEAIARKVAEDIGIDYFDETTYQPSRLMYWPSVSSDGVYTYSYIDAPFLSADEVLAKYPGWQDTSYWPESSRASGIRKRMANKQGDPTTKKGVIGAFCRTYTVTEAIETFLADIYTACETPGRYTYTAGSTAAGLVIYDGDLFAYSNHGTDPASGKLCNAFDLVRIHLFGHLDGDTVESDTTKLASYKAMMQMAVENKEVKVQLTKERMMAAKEDFEAAETPENLQYGENGQLLNTMGNIATLIKTDTKLRGIYMDEMSGQIEIDSPCPWNKDRTGAWRDADEAQLMTYLESYGRFSKTKIQDSIVKVADDRRRHPIREYLEGLPKWDGVKRVDTLLSDYLGADNTEYVRQVTRKTLCGAVYRIMQAGCKHDTVLVLNGPQGIGKSTLISRLGGQWYTDDLSLADTKDKTAVEKIQGKWIVEIGEMAGMRKAEIETLRGFITRQIDRFRPAYGRNVVSRPRQCIFIGTTNAENGYLKDLQGNRRFWDVQVTDGALLRPWDLTQEDINQIWAEARHYCDQGESVILTGEVLEEARERQLEALESDPREGQVREYLDTLIPADWYNWKLERRRDYFAQGSFEDARGTMRRMEVSNVEIWAECFGMNRSAMQPKDSYAIAGIMKKIRGWDRKDTAKRMGDYGLQRGYSRKE